MHKKVPCFLKGYFLIIPCDRIKPPNAMSISTANAPNVLATIMFLPAAAIKKRKMFSKITLSYLI